MHAFNRFLSVDGEKQLRDRKRLTLLFARAHALPLAAALVFLFVGLIVGGAGGSYFVMHMWPDPSIPAYAKIAVAFCVVSATILFPFFSVLNLIEVAADPIFLYVMRPDLVDFATGIVKDTGYVPHGRSRAFDRIVVVAELTKLTGEKWTVRQFFRARGWPFVGHAAENQKAGRRPTLPFPAHFIYCKNAPNRSALCGMPVDVFERARRFRQAT